MSNFNKPLSPSRRSFLHKAAGGFGGLALSSMLCASPAPVSGTHFPARAKRVIQIFCSGGLSHVDTFDYKPALKKLDGQKPPQLPAVTFEGPSGNIAKPFWDFQPKGETGKMVSDLLPALGNHVDDFCFFHSLSTETSAHPQGENFMNTGFTMEGFPSFGSWSSYF